MHEISLVAKHLRTGMLMFASHTLDLISLPKIVYGRMLLPGKICLPRFGTTDTPVLGSAMSAVEVKGPIVA